MRQIISKFLHTITLAAVGVAVVTSVLAVGVVSIVPAQPASAASCTQDSFPETNILYCGVPTSSASAALQSFKTQFDNNSDGHGHTDIKSIYGASKSGYSGGQVTSTMFTTGTWVLGTSFSNGNIVDNNGKLVGTNTQISSRCFSEMSNCQPASKYQHLVSNAYTRDATWFFDKDTNHKVSLIHINGSGVADFAMWAPCGNELFFKPVIPAPKKVLACVSLDKEADLSKSFTYNFGATAHRENVTIDNYFFTFGDNSSTEIQADVSNQETAKASHTYNQTDVEQTLNIQVFVNIPGQHGTAGVTSGACAQQIVIPPKQKLTFACQQLDAKLTDSTSTSRTYSFTATTQGTDTAKDYQFVFGDNNSTAEQASNAVTHTYAIDTTKVQSFTAFFVADSNGGSKTDQNDKNCQFSFATQLVRTGPGDTFAIVAFASTGGIALHQLILRRRLI